MTHLLWYKEVGCSHTWVFVRCAPAVGKLSLILNTNQYKKITYTHYIYHRYMNRITHSYYKFERTFSRALVLQVYTYTCINAFICYTSKCLLHIENKYSLQHAITPIHTIGSHKHDWGNGINPILFSPRF